MPDPQTAKVASGGKQVRPEDLPTYVEFKKEEMPEEVKKRTDWFYSTPIINDFTNLQEISAAIYDVMRKKAAVNFQLRQARKKSAGTKYYYERAKRRQLVTVTGSSDRIRMAMAEMNTEELETEWIVATSEEEEYKSLLRNLTKEAEDLKEISYNMRKEIEFLNLTNGQHRPPGA